MENISDTKKQLLKELNEARNVLTFSLHEVTYYDLLLQKEETEESLSNDIELLKNYSALPHNEENADSNQTRKIISEWCLKGLKKVKSIDRDIDEIKEKRCNAAKKLVNKK